MTLFRYLAAALMLTLVMTSHALQPAFAQGTTIIVLDDAQVFQDSRAGKDIQTKLRNIETQINNELDPSRRALETLAQSIQPKLQGKTPEEIGADAALVAELNRFQQQRQEFAQKQQVVSQEFALTQQQALVDFTNAVEPIIMEVMQERNAQIVMEKGMALFTADSIDVTADIVAKLDQRTPAIAVTRRRVPAQPQQ